MTLEEIAKQLREKIEEFQAANNTRLKLIEDGIQNPTLDNKVTALNHDITQLKELGEKNARMIGRLTQGGAGGDDQQTRRHAARFFSAALGRRVRPDDSALDLDGYRAYRHAFEEIVRGRLNLEHLSSDIRAALRIGSDPDGGYLVPEEISSEMERRIHDSSPMRQLARTITISGSAWEAPYKSSKGVSGGWVGEQQARPATGTGQVGMQRIPVQEQYAYPEATQSILDDGAIPIESFLIDDTQDEMSRTENLAFVSGNGVLKPRGFLDYSGAAVTTDDASRSWGVLQYIPVGAAGAFPLVSGSTASDPDALITAISKLNPGYRQGAVWTMTRGTEAAIRKLKDADGRYLIGFGDLRDGVTGFSLLGFPIVNFEDMPAIASNSYSIAFGNFRGYLIVDRIGFRVLRDPYTNKPYVGFYITKRLGGDVRNFDAIKLIKFAAS
jgi:HK97 family phage major capsid protein